MNQEPGQLAREGLQRHFSKRALPGFMVDVIDYGSDVRVNVHSPDEGGPTLSVLFTSAEREDLDKMNQKFDEAFGFYAPVSGA